MGAARSIGARRSIGYAVSAQGAVSAARYWRKAHYEALNMVEYIIIGFIAAALAAIAFFIWRRER